VVDLVKFLKSVDRRVIYVLLFVAVALPLLVPAGLPIDISPDVRSIYDAIDELPAGSIMLVSFDYDPASRAEVHPMAEAVLRHAFKRKLRVVAPALWPQGPSQATSVLEKLKREFNLTYGKDFVQLAYFNGPTVGLPQVTAIMGDLHAAYPTDVKGNKLDTMELTRSITAAKDIAMIFTLSAGDPGIPAWVQIANGRYGTRVAGGATAVQVAQFLPYVQGGQMIGMIGGLKGAAEYEKLLDYKGIASASMDAQSLGHIVIMAFIILANVTYLLERLTRSGGAL
jgi:hypothetical protein